MTKAMLTLAIDNSATRLEMMVMTDFPQVVSNVVDLQNSGIVYGLLHEILLGPKMAKAKAMLTVAIDHAATKLELTLITDFPQVGSNVVVLQNLGIDYGLDHEIL